MLIVTQTAFDVIGFLAFSDLHKVLGGFQMTPSLLHKQTASCKLPHDWLVSLAMDLAALCDTCMWS